MYKDHQKRWSFFLFTPTAVENPVGVTTKKFIEQRLVLLLGDGGDAPFKFCAGIEQIKYF
jgi:hypothetical protein